MPTRSTSSEYQPAPPYMRQSGGGKKNGSQNQQVRVSHSSGLRQNNASIAPIVHMGDTGDKVLYTAREVAVSPSIHPSSE